MSDADMRRVVDTLVALPSKIPEIIDLQWGNNNSPGGLNDGFTHCLPGLPRSRASSRGTNNSPETHNAGFTHAFMVTFESEAGRAEYLPHADHQDFIEVLKPVLDKVRVLDCWSQAE